MPSQIAHILFADGCLEAAFGAAAAQAVGNRPLFYFAAQGPDFFFHNGFSRPSGRTFGSLLHRRSYGAVVRHMAGALRVGSKADLHSFLLGFATHPFLDRSAHPFVDYFAGWEDPERPETHKYYRCHAFFERIIDVLLLDERRGIAADDFPVAELLDCGPRLPEAVASALAEALRSAFGGLDMTRDAEVRVQNAYRDAIGFYLFTSSAASREAAAARDRSGPDRRRLALFHPTELPPDVDFLNAGHARWVHPCDAGRQSRASFDELFDGAVAPAAAALLALDAAARGGPLEPVEALIGNGSLNTESPATGRRRFSAPLPLPELIERLYEAGR